MEYINKLYEAYPVLAQIDEENKGILGEKAIFKIFLQMNIYLQMKVNV